ncbi:hypothetical protein OAT04_05795 [Candidatus Pelagibacter sp.]|nr:hypothetical protein [Candidatus Pelagibacter sp.]
MIKKIKNNIFILFFTSFNTVTGTALGVVKDVKSTYHYTTCIFTKVTCGDLDLD